jgi:hypothetical protein
MQQNRNTGKKTPKEMNLPEMVSVREAIDI